MRLLLPKFGLPLLARELIQQSARRRTFIVRVVYATILYVAAFWYYQRWTASLRPESFEALGQGRELFEMLVRWQLWGIYLFLPLMTCSVITSEKERQTLPLLKLTRLGSWTILFEKLTSRLMEMGTYLLLPAPLAAMAYGFGGVEVQDLIDTAFVLFLVSLHVGSFSLMCSTWFRTTAGAMAGVYLIGAAAHVLEPLTMKWAMKLVIYCLNRCGLQDWLQLLVSQSAGGSGFQISHRIILHPFSGSWLLGFDDQAPVDFPSFVPPYLDGSFNGDIQIFFGTMDVESSSSTFLTGIAAGNSTGVLFRSIPMVFSVLVFLVFARGFLWRRADPGSWRLRNIVNPINRMFLHFNVNSHTRGRTPGISSDLPTAAPIAWYEKRLRLVGGKSHLLRMLMAFELPLALWLAWESAHSLSLLPILESTWKVLWLSVLLLVIAISTGLIPAERSRQTLDVLLVAPLTDREIVIQKMAGLNTLIRVLCIPLLTILLVQAYVSIPPINHADPIPGYFSTLQWRRLGALELMVSKRFAATCLYLPLVAWMGFQLGLRLKNQVRAITSLVFVLLGICGIPRLVEWMMLSPDPIGVTDFLISTGIVGWLTYFDPSQMIFGAKVPDSWSRSIPIQSGEYLDGVWLSFLFHFLVVGGMLWAVRRNALRNFSRLVCRTEAIPVWRSPMTVSDSSPLISSLAPGLPDVKDAADAESNPTSFVPRQN